jgi:serine/threonine protein kinase
MTNKTKKRKIQKEKEKKGGNVLASGGYGCVFSPALICEGEKVRPKNKISKLMTEKHALSEYNEIASIKKKLHTIKDYTDFFLINDVTLCKPAPLTSSDINNFSNKCRALPKDDITKSNINTKLDTMLALNMPHGGIPVDDSFYEKGSFKKMYSLHVKLARLLEKGIVPMNKMHVYHCDIKDSNILVGFDMETRLVDWGLSLEYIPFKDHTFPRTWRNRPLQFNVPFSVILFSDRFIEKYTDFLQKGGKPNAIDLRPFLIDYISLWMKERGLGHYKLINEMMFILFSSSITSISKESKLKMVETQITLKYIVDYLIDVLVHFTKPGIYVKESLRDYLDKVFIQYVDIWGFISVYIVYIEFLFNNYDKLTIQEMELFNKLKHIFVEYLYSPRHTAIPMDGLYSDLKDLEDLLYKLAMPKKSKSKKPNITRRNYARGVQNKRSSITFKRKPKQRRFKKPFLMSIK